MTGTWPPGADLRLRVCGRTHKEIREAATAEGLSVHAWLRAAISRGLRAKDNVAAFREIQVIPRSSELTIDSMLEILAGRRGTVSDLMPTGGTVNPKLRRAMRACLTATELRRMELVLFHGKRLEEVGHEEGASKQAIHKSVASAHAKLLRSDDFIEALAECFPDSGVTGAQLRAIRRGHGARTQG